MSFPHTFHGAEGAPPPGAFRHSRRTAFGRVQHFSAFKAPSELAVGFRHAGREAGRAEEPGLAALPVEPPLADPA